MIPSLDELRKRLVPEPTIPEPAREPTAESESPPPPAPSPVRVLAPASPEFQVLRQNLPKFGPRSRTVCRLCRKPPDCSVILRPKHLKPRPTEISRSSLAGWLKHDFVFFGESYLCEDCAKAEGFI